MKCQILLDQRYEELLSRTEIYKCSSKEHFVFLDPPMIVSLKIMDIAHLGKKEQERLSTLFKESQNRCLMIIGKSPLISQLYEDYIVDEYDKKYRFKIHSGRVNEANKHLIIKNF